MSNAHGLPMGPEGPCFAGLQPRLRSACRADAGTEVTAVAHLCGHQHWRETGLLTSTGGAPTTHAQPLQVASLPLLALALCWTVVLILSFSLSLLSFGLAYSLLSLRRVHAWIQESLAPSLDGIIDGGQRALKARAEERAKARPGQAQAALNVQAAMGVVLLSVAAAAVFWKVKPE
ncbi:hypothetical protein HYPSUDRAFT_209575 [Hypholoma sublateritium FD-334 SS-4]|uniref:Uncharacterized protein n=1 Tax=Hypholoma sublateritium (strain FD-334 SS-4) TaxID=945553 RepID=A0A0D2NY47_HYPSF|nr:hypothetical protein HYPSUDRAFT_209575 [Hypholoma sublateritium FD-334 SS-4]